MFHMYFPFIGPYCIPYILSSYSILHILHPIVYRSYSLYYCISCIFFPSVSPVSSIFCIICDKVLYSIKVSDSTVFSTQLQSSVSTVLHISRCDKVPYSISVSDSTVFSTQLQSSANQGCASLKIVGSKLSHTKVTLKLSH